MALQAEQVGVAQFQHMGIGSTVRQMAGLTSVDLHRLVFENKGALLVRVALEAHRVLRGRSPHLVGLYRSVHVVAIAAAQQAFIHLVVEGHRKRRLDAGVAAVAERRLGRD